MAGSIPTFLFSYTFFNYLFFLLLFSSNLTPKSFFLIYRNLEFPLKNSKQIQKLNQTVNNFFFNSIENQTTWKWNKFFKHRSIFLVNHLKRTVIEFPNVSLWQQNNVLRTTVISVQNWQFHKIWTSKKKKNGNQICYRNENWSIAEFLIQFSFEELILVFRMTKFRMEINGSFA